MCADSWFLAPEASENVGLLCVWPVGMAEGPLSGIEVLVHDLCHLSRGQEHGRQGAWDQQGDKMEGTIIREQPPPEDRVACSSWLGELTLKFSRELQERVAISRWHPLRGGEMQEG